MFRTLTRTFGRVAPYSYSTYALASDIPASEERTRINLFQAVNSAIDLALAADPTYLFPHSALKSSVKMSSSVEYSGVPQA